MRGLFMKDTRLLLIQQKFIILLLVLTFVLTINIEDFFAMMYLPFVCSFFVLGTLSYDEDSNGYLFLMSLPLDRKTYVNEKYVFSILVCTVTELAGFLIELICHMWKPETAPLKEGIQLLPIIFASIMLLMSFLLPIRLIYGAEKGKIATLIGAGIITLLGTFGIRFLEKSGLAWRETLHHVFAGNMLLIEGMFLLFSLAVTEGSRRISIRIMEKKEF